MSQKPRSRRARRRNDVSEVNEVREHPNQAIKAMVSGEFVVSENAA